jgi:non-canonical (house-cleaning) NTP pyrophosphatase
MAGMAQGEELGNKHRDMRRSETLKIESSIMKTHDITKDFINPVCEEAAVKLIALSSGASVPVDIQHNVLRAEKAGEVMKEVLITKKLMANDHFFEPVKQLNLTKMAAMNKAIHMKTTKKKIVEYKQQGNIAFQLLV